MSCTHILNCPDCGPDFKDLREKAKHPRPSPERLERKREIRRARTERILEMERNVEALRAWKEKLEAESAAMRAVLERAADVSVTGHDYVGEAEAVLKSEAGREVLAVVRAANRIHRLEHPGHPMTHHGECPECEIYEALARVRERGVL